MNARIDPYTNLPDRGLERDAALEAKIDAAFKSMKRAPTDIESKSWWTEIAVLMRRRSMTQLLKLELERRMRT